MLISCNQLKKYIKNASDIDFKGIWDTFTMKSAEVENVYEKGNDLKDVVSAKIVSCSKHPDSKKLSLLKVSDGKNEYDIVCGAPNVKVGLIGALVKVGGKVSGMDITSRKLAGYVSNGMMCALDELGIGDDHGGILELPSDTPLGVDLCELYPIKDIIVEIDNKSLTNRPDLWGHYGIAREIAAITDHELLPLDIYEPVNNLSDLDIKVSSMLCNRFCGIKVGNLKNNITPIEMQIFLSYVGMRSINLFVDLTNYLMLELGQPMHCYDERVVKNIVVDLANKGDKFTTLDGVERTLNDDTLMISNGDEYFGIAGVMGGMASEVLEDTNAVFLESANFQAGSIRKTAVSLGLRTDASAHYEKSLDPNLCDFALKRLLFLLQKENSDMQVLSNLTDVYPNKLEEKTIILNKETISRYTSIKVSEEEIKKTLEALGFKVEVLDESYQIIVPTFRATKDVTMDADIIEEITRMYGYDNMQEIPLCGDDTAIVHENTWEQEYEMKNYLATSFNLNEVHSYVWYEQDMLNKLGIVKDGIHLLTNVKNNLLRDDLTLSLLPIVKNNLKNRNSLGIFEIGSVFFGNSSHRHLSIVLADNEECVYSLYYRMKEILETIFKYFKNREISYVSFEGADYYHKEKSKMIACGDTLVGELQAFESTEVNYVGKKKCVIAADIDIEKFISLEKKEIIFEEINKYPAVNLDYTIIANKDMKYEALAKILDDFHDEIILSYELVDVYHDTDKCKYTIRYKVGSNECTLNGDILEKFKNDFILHIQNNNLEIVF